jgi:hypothetical protein
MGTVVFPPEQVQAARVIKRVVEQEMVMDFLQDNDPISLFYGVHPPPSAGLARRRQARMTQLLEKLGITVKQADDVLAYLAYREATEAPLDEPFWGPPYWDEVHSNFTLYLMGDDALPGG